MGDHAWVIYHDVEAIYTGRRPCLRSIMFVKQEDGTWKPDELEVDVTRHNYDLMAINVLNAARPMLK